MSGELEKCVYLDNAGGARPTSEQLSRIFEDLRTLSFSNPHSRNPASKLTTDLIDQIRYRILSFVGAAQDEYTVIFTAGATAALKLVAESFEFAGTETNYVPESSSYNFSDIRNKPPGPSFVYLNDNHTSVLGMREIIQSRKAANIACITADQVSAIFAENQEPLRNEACSNLFVYPSQSNFCGQKYPLDWTAKTQSGCLGPGNWYVCLDAASHLSTSPINLSKVKPDFLVLSFYKIFGYPTGLGGLIVRNSSAHTLKKTYFGGGTVEVALPSLNFHQKRANISDRFEDGTLDYLGIISLQHGFDAIDQKGGMKAIQKEVFRLASFTYGILSSLTHGTGNPVAEILVGPHKFQSPDKQGGILTFNLLKDDGTFVGFTEIEKMAELYCIQLRTGCFCNQGACQKYLALSDDDVRLNFQNGKVCGDKVDLINGKPVGAVRVSFGWTSTMEDAKAFLGMIYDCFVTNPVVRFSELAEHGIPVYQHSEQEPGSSKSSNKTASSQYVLTDIFIYPLKSGGGLRVDHWPLSETGLQYDRSWMVADSNGLCLTQKRAAKLCSIQPQISGSTVRLQALGFEDLTIEPTPKDSQEPPLHQSKICASRVETEDCGRDAGIWISKVLSLNGSRLLRQSRNSPRISSGEGPVSLANVAQYLLVNRSSVRRLLPLVHSVYPLITEDELVGRFRPNLVVEAPAPGEEDSWTRLSIGNAEFKATGKCQRCQMVCINQRTGEKDPKLLSALRDISKGTMTFGIYLARCGERELVSISAGEPIVVQSQLNPA